MGFTVLHKLKTMSITSKEAPPSLVFTSLPNDIVLNILARVPRRYYQILSYVSNKLRSLVRSSELHKTRYLMGKNGFYVCFVKYGSDFSTSYHWFTLTEDRRLVSNHFPSPDEPYSAALMVSHEIYFVGGSISHPTKNLWILDSRSRKLRLGPSSHMANASPLVRLVRAGLEAIHMKHWVPNISGPALRLVDDKIFVFGEIEAQVFDLKTQTWEMVLNPIMELQDTWMSVASLSIYARDTGLDIMCYTSKDLCMVENVMYTYNASFGLMWYHFKEKEWRVVQGLKLNKYDLWNIKIVEYDGKLAILWHETKTMEFWCAMISLCRRGVEEIQGRIEWSNCLLSNIPFECNIIHCLCRTD